MNSLRLRITFDEAAIHPIHELVCASPAIERELLLEGKSVDGTETILTYVEGDREVYEEVLAARPETVEYDITPDGEGSFFVYARWELRDRERRLEAALARETVIVVPPLEFRPDRTMTLSLIGHSADLEAAVEGLPEGLNAEVLRVGEYQGYDTANRLTDRQREALTVAQEAGYYRVPRENGIEAVASELGCAVSTASALLRRAESRLVTEALEARA